MRYLLRQILGESEFANPQRYVTDFSQLLYPTRTGLWIMLLINFFYNPTHSALSKILKSKRSWYDFDYSKKLQ